MKESRGIFGISEMKRIVFSGRFFSQGVRTPSFEYSLLLFFNFSYTIIISGSEYSVQTLELQKELRTANCEQVMNSSLSGEPRTYV